jgi:glutathione synthase/RimK-type ligase-like ATP-grasp enzyme
VDVRAVDVVWWRRFNQPAKVSNRVGAIARDIITNDCRSSIEGLLVNEFRGVWVNAPEATRSAENKLIQLRAAQRAGFRVPKTLVSQDPAAIRRFCAELGNEVVVKAVRGTTKAGLLTLKVDAKFLDGTDAMLMLAPAIYQELIEGTQHIRANCFGENVYAARIDSAALDWRTDLSVPVTNIKLPDTINARLINTLSALDLRMGIVDLKMTPSGEPVWLEVNPQGQFLFIEGLTGVPLASAFSDFLCTEKRL